MIKSKQLVEEYRKQIGKYTYEQMDCIRSIENIISRHGGRSAIVGSNWWARNEIINLRPLTDKSQLYDGCAVLKTRMPGESGYDLPDRYKKDAVFIDYNHIGLGTDQGEILDSTRYMSGDSYVRNGPDVSTAPIGPDSWDVIGDFEDVDYSDRQDAPDGAPELAIRAFVQALTGTIVNLRKEQSMKSTVIEYVKTGSVVEVLEQQDGWWFIKSASGKKGWMMSDFLSIVTGEPSSDRSRIMLILDEQDSLITRLMEVSRAMREAV